VADDGRPRTGIGIPRWALDAILLDNARERGARVHEGVRVLGVRFEAGRVAGVRVQTPGGEETLQSRFVVGADGHHSAVARSLGLERRVLWPRRLGLIARYEQVRGIDDVGQMHVGPGLYCGLAPVGEGLVNVGLVVDLRSKVPGEPVARFFGRRVLELPGVARALSGARRVTPVRGVGPLARRVRRVVGPGYLLVGDAAGFLDPFTGEGVYKALRGAELAAAALDDALRAGREVADGYARARREEFADKDLVSVLVQLFLGSHRLFEYVTRHLARRPELARVLAGVLGDYRPAREALRPTYLWSLLSP
jgi:menaquinone-9 beta-reductase